MCGIVGFWSKSTPAQDAPQVLTAMEQALAHRGPDDHDIWYDAPAGVGFGHRRLSIVDLSPMGHQPMASASGRYVIAFNGEVYNWAPLAEELRARGHAFRGHSDTEVMLAAIEQWGLAAAVRRFIGMFAFALWDRDAQTLHLVRDRLGIKPLYYGWQGGAFLFGSELKGLREHPHFVGDIDRNALTLFLRHNYIPAPWSIYLGIFKQPSGTILSVSNVTDPGSLTIAPFWSAREVAESGQASPFVGTEDEAIDELETLLRDSVRLRMVADVPLGAFLSGGVDSSTIVALMQAQSSRPVKTFSIGFTEEAYNEAPYAKAVAQHLGTEHTELYVAPHEAMDVIPRLPWMYDEPFADSSQIPTFLVSALTRRHVTVSLSGDGGDELFGGYGRYAQTQRLWSALRRVPPGGRRLAAGAIAKTPDAVLDTGFAWLGPIYRRYGRDGRPSDKLRKAADLFRHDSPDSLYLDNLSYWGDPAALVPGAAEPRTALTDAGRRPTFDDLYHTMMFADLISYLPDDILVKVDRASMAVALEARVPILDHRVVEFAWRLPLSLKVREGQSKWILRRVLDRYVPRTLIDRPKMGFGIPLHEWLRGPLREWGDALLDPARLRAEGLIDPGPIHARWIEHQSGTRNWGYAMWGILMFQAWYEAERSARAGKVGARS